MLNLGFHNSMSTITHTTCDRNQSMLSIAQTAMNYPSWQLVRQFQKDNCGAFSGQNGRAVLIFVIIPVSPKYIYFRIIRLIV